MNLEIWGGDFGLPSVDVKCLQMIALGKFLNLDITYVQKNINPLFGTKLPKFIHENNKFTEYESLINYFISKNLISKNTKLINILSYKKLFEEKLEPAIKYIFWMNEANYVQITRKTFAKLCKFPFNYFVPMHLKNETKNYFQVLYKNLLNDRYFETKIIEKAKECIKLLSTKLGEESFFEEIPGELDALIFGYLAIILNIKFPFCDNLRRFTSEQLNLVKYTDRILNQYFQIKSKPKIAKNLIENLETASWKDIIFTGLFSTTLMVLFSIYIGLIEINYLDDENKLSKDENDEKITEDELKKYEMPMPVLDMQPEIFPNLNKSSNSKESKKENDNKKDT